MSKIAKGSAMAAAVLGILASLFGLGVSICAWTLSGKVSGLSISSSNTVNINFGSYWWGGMSYVVPGILGIIAGCTRNVTAMIFYMIFNILSLFASIAVSIMVALLVLAWAVIEGISNQGGCVDTTTSFMKQCTCTDYNGNIYSINNLTCSDVKDIQTILAAIIALTSISSLIAFISSYVSCCALCNQESDAPATVIVQGGAGAYQPPNVIVSNTTSQQYVQQPQYPGYPAPGYNQPPAYNQAPGYGHPHQPYDNPTPQYGSKVNLVKSEVI